MNHSKKTLPYVLLATLFVASFVVGANEVNAVECKTQQECQDALKANLEKHEEVSGTIQVKDTEIKTISGEINKLTGEINKTAGEIKKKDSLIGNIRNDIVRKENSLSALNDRLERERASLERIIRKQNELEGATLFEVILSSEDISTFYEDAPNFAYLQESLSDSFNIIDELKVSIYNEKSALEKRREQENNAKYSLQLDKNKIEVIKKDRDTALSITSTEKQGLEEYRKQLEKEAQEIRSRMIQFQGSGITSRSISFGEAYDYAKFAEGKTGVDAAFIMAIMQQETGFGNNVGGCHVTDLTTGDGKGINTGTAYERVMGSGSLPHFAKITSALGLDWKVTPVSCPIDIKRVGTATKYYEGRGFGGAMGYTQFIPSTWILVEARVRSYLGVAAASPWNPQHAVMATAVLAKDLGASGKPSANYNAYYNAACRYYGACSTYASSVMAKTAAVQTEVTKLER